MLYLAHFDFHVEPKGKAKKAAKTPRRATAAPKAEPQHGYFTCVAEAKSVEAAMTKFERLLQDLKAKDDIFDGVKRIYLDSCVEVNEMPAKGFLAHYVRYLGESGENAITTSVRGYKGKAISAYMIGGEDEEEEGGHVHGDDEDEDEVESIEPFVEFK